MCEVVRLFRTGQLDQVVEDAVAVGGDTFSACDDVDHNVNMAQRMMEAAGAAQRGADVGAAKIARYLGEIGGGGGRGI